MSAPAVPALRRGGEGAQEAAEAAGGGRFQKVHYFSLEKDETAVLRFLTDSPDWIYVNQHQFVPTKPKPAGYDKKWPKSMTAVCRKDPAFAAMYPDGCYVCDGDIVNDYGKPIKPNPRVWALACRREEVKEDGKVVGYRDATREEEEFKDGEATGKKITVKDIVVVNAAFSNFFGALQGYYSVFGTVLDRDYHITRTKDGKDTDYNIIGLNPIQDPRFEGGVYDVRVPEVAERYKNDIDLVKVITEKTTDEFYGRFFDPRYVEKPKEGEGGAQGSQDAPQGAPAEQQGKPASDVSDEALAAMQARVRGFSGDAKQEDTPPSSDGGAPASGGDAAPAAAPAAGGFRNFD